jgi:hypothetical protein
MLALAVRSGGDKAVRQARLSCAATADLSTSRVGFDLLSTMKPYTPHEDVEALLRREARARLPLRRQFVLYLDPFALFKDASSGPPSMRRSALSYNRARRRMLLTYIRRWLLIAAGSLVGIAQAEAPGVEAPLLIVLAAGLGIAFSIAVGVVACAGASYLFLGARLPNTR